MATVNLPTIAIDDTQIPRLRTALRAALSTIDGVASTVMLNGVPTLVTDLTDAQLYKVWVIRSLQAAVRNYEQVTAARQATAGVADPPTLA